jgi:tRNA dimethylallyltransferase
VKPVLVVVGPTASGKTRLGIELARALHGEIVSADSMQFYRGMEIGTAAPTPAERAEAVHHFVSFLDPDRDMAAGEYQRLARARIADVQARGRTAVVVGGSGLYLRALMDGLFDGPPRDEALRARLRQEGREHGNARLMDRLRRIDPDYAAALTSENDQVRLVRALEVYELTGTTLSELHRRHRETLEAMPVMQAGIRMDRGLLYQRIDRRVDMMLEAGWIAETRRLLEAGYGPHLDRLKALGYRELSAHLRGEQDLAAAVAAAKQHHRRYAKRQMTWFRADPRIHWLDWNPQAGPDVLVSRTLDLWSAHFSDASRADETHHL